MVNLSVNKVTKMTILYDETFVDMDSIPRSDDMIYHSEYFCAGSTGWLVGRQRGIQSARPAIWAQGTCALKKKNPPTHNL